MLKKISIAAASSAIATLAAVSGASAVSFSGAGGGLPPGAPANTSGLFESSITVTDDIIIDDISLDLNDLTHTWAGDLVVDLTYDDGAGTVITAAVSNGVGGPTDFDGDYTFEDGGAVFPGAGNPIPGGIYSPNESFLDAFAGINVAGTWTLSINDRFFGDSGSLGSWDLNVEGDPVSTPEPVSLFALFGIGALGVTSLKRKQKEEK